MNDAEKQALVAALGKVIVDEVKRSLEPVQQELARLTLKLEHAELRVREMRYCGIWSDRGIYKMGNFVTHSGSLWHANVDHVSTVPGQDPTAWTLAVKSTARG